MAEIALILGMAISNPANNPPKRLIMKASGKTWLALLGGMALGTILGILLAPEKGSETRARLKDKAKDLGEKARNFLDTKAPGQKDGA